VLRNSVTVNAKITGNALYRDLYSTGIIEVRFVLR